MIIYCRDNELYTEEEALDVARDQVEFNEWHLQALSEMDLHTLWSMLTEENQYTIMNSEIERVLLEEFNNREF